MNAKEYDVYVLQSLYLQEVACVFPESEWKERSYLRLQHDFPHYMDYDSVFRSLWADILYQAYFKPWMVSFRMMAARAVQPTGDVDELAPLVGIVRLHEWADLAAKELGRRLIALIRAGKISTLNNAMRMIERPLGEHRNYHIWTAIMEVILEKTEQLDLAAWDKRFDVDLNRIPDAMKLAFPESKEVKQYVQNAQDEERFAMLPAFGDGWSELWTESGAREMVRMSKGGRPRKR